MNCQKKKNQNPIFFLLVFSELNYGRFSTRIPLLLNLTTNLATKNITPTRRGIPII